MAFLKQYDTKNVKRKTGKGHDACLETQIGEIFALKKLVSTEKVFTSVCRQNSRFYKVLLRKRVVCSSNCSCPSENVPCFDRMVSGPKV